jgi:hypothetical protein
MNTPPTVENTGRNTPPSQWATPIVTIPKTPPSHRNTPPSQWATPIVTIPKTPPSQRNTQKSYRKPIIQKHPTSYREKNHSDYLRQRLDEIYSRNNDNRNSNYEDRVEETAKMVFRLPKKPGGEQSTKRAKKYRKKTLKKRVRK